MNYYDIIEAIYIIYMYNFFKTTKSIHNPLEYYIFNQPIENIFKHPIDTGEYENKICTFGNIVGWLLGIWILSRNILYTDSNRKNNKINKIIFILVLIGSLMMNMNAFIYLIPVFIYEFVY